MNRSHLLRGLILSVMVGTAGAQTPIHTTDTDCVELGTIGRAHEVGDLDQDGIQDYGMIRFRTHHFFEEFWVYSGATGIALQFIPLSLDPSGILVQFFQPAGDLNGDGVDDILAANPSYDIPGQGSNYGRVYVLSGVDLSVLQTVQGTIYGESLGRAICAVGDMDQDGVVDFAASGETFLPTMSGAFVRVFSGATGQVIREWAEPNLLSYGHVIDCLGDVDLDGFPDLLIGSDGYPTFGFFADGAAWVVSGGTGNVLYMVSGNVPANAQGANRFATNLAALGDIDGDAISDFAVTAVNDNTQGPGMLWVFSGASGNVIHQIPGEDVFIGPGGPLAMWRVSAAGDVNGDGVRDILASHAGGTLPVGFTPGIVRVYSGADGSKLMQLDGRREGDELFGRSISALDDVNGDGFADFLVAIKGRVTGKYSQSFPTIPLDGAVVIYSGTCLAPTPYCTASVNSTGVAANLASQGSLSLTANDLVLTVTGGVPGQFGLFFYGGGAVNIPLGDGRLCVGAGSQGLYRLNPAHQTDATGSLNLPIDFTQHPMAAGPGEVTSTSTWNFQFWYRDSAGGGSGFNLSNALEVYVCP